MGEAGAESSSAGGGVSSTGAGGGLDKEVQLLMLRGDSSTPLGRLGLLGLVFVGDSFSFVCSFSFSFPLACSFSFSFAFAFLDFLTLFITTSTSTTSSTISSSSTSISLSSCFCLFGNEHTLFIKKHIRHLRPLYRIPETSTYWHFPPSGQLAHCS